MTPGVKVVVYGLNGVGTSAIAQVIAEALKAANFPKVEFIEPDHPPRDKTRLEEITLHIRDRVDIEVTSARFGRAST